MFTTFRKISWLFTVLFGLALVGATFMNVVMVGQARKALEEGILGGKNAPPVLEYHVALVIPDTADSFFEGLNEGVLASAAKSAVAIQTFRYRSSVPEDEETSFQLCLSAHLDGIILYSGPDGDLGSRQTQARAENVVFVPVGSLAPRKTAQGFIGSSPLLQGIESGNELTRKRGNSARIGLILTSVGEASPPFDPMFQGISVAIQSYPGAKIVQASRARPGILSGEEAASVMLRSDPSINVLVCASAPITEGAAQVVVDQGRVGQVLIIGTDETPTIDRLIDSGVIVASVVRDSHKMGAEAVQAFVQEKKGTLFSKVVEFGFTIRGKKDPAK